MQTFEYLCPETLEQALATLHELGASARVYAGGTDLMVQLREHAARLRDVTALVDLQKLHALREISETDTALRIGALASHTAVETSPIVRRHAPVLAASSSQVGSPQIRNLGTIGGNVANASPAADTISALAALSAEVEVASTGGVRRVPLPELYQGAGKTALAPDEIIVSFTIPKKPGWRSAFCKLGRRKALAISRLNAAVLLQMDGEMILDARIAPGCVFSAPDRVVTAEAMLKGQQASSALFARAGEETAEEMVRRSGVRWSTAYKKPALAAVVSEALEKAWRETI